MKFRNSIQWFVVATGLIVANMRGADDSTELNVPGVQQDAFEPDVRPAQGRVDEFGMEIPPMKLPSDFGQSEPMVSGAQEFRVADPVSVSTDRSSLSQAGPSGAMAEEGLPQLDFANVDMDESLVQPYLLPQENLNTISAQGMPMAAGVGEQAASSSSSTYFNNLSVPASLPAEVQEQEDHNNAASASGPAQEVSQPERLGSPEIAVADDQTVQCKVCQSRLKNNETLKAHLIDIHGGQELVECQECHSTFADSSDLQVHVMRDKCSRIAKRKRTVARKSRLKRDSEGSGDEDVLALRRIAGRGSKRKAEDAADEDGRGDVPVAKRLKKKKQTEPLPLPVVPNRASARTLAPHTQSASSSSSSHQNGGASQEISQAHAVEPRQEAQRAASASPNGSDSQRDEIINSKTYCYKCKKQFGNAWSLAQHKGSKKHKRKGLELDGKPIPLKLLKNRYYEPGVHYFFCPHEGCLTNAADRANMVAHIRAQHGGVGLYKVCSCGAGFFDEEHEKTHLQINRRCNAAKEWRMRNCHSADDQEQALA